MPISNRPNYMPSRPATKSLFVGGGLQANVTAASGDRVEKVPKTHKERLTTLGNWGKRLPTHKLHALAESAGISYQQGWRYVRNYLLKHPSSANLFGSPEFLQDYRYRQLRGIFLPISEGHLSSVLSLNKRLLGIHVLDASFNFQDNVGYSERAGVFLADFGELVTNPSEIATCLAMKSWQRKRWYLSASSVVRLSVDAHFERARNNLLAKEAREIKAMQ